MNLTLRQCYDQFYVKDDLSSASLFGYLATLKRWEELTSNPAVQDITDETLEAFKAVMLAAGVSPVTVNSKWRHIRALLRRVGPQVTGNPHGLQLIDRVPQMRKCRVPFKMPRIVTEDDLNRFYVACSIAKFPRLAGPPPAEYWRALLVLGYFTAMRKGDLLSIRTEQIDREAGTLHFVASKTGKEAFMPLHPCALAHINRIWGSAGELLFPKLAAKGGDYSERWRAICEHAGIKPFTLQVVRRTAATAAERIRHGMGSVLCQHTPLNVTGFHYLNRFDELRETILQMPVPVAFGHGPKQADRNRDRQKQERERLMKTADFAVPCKPDPSAWKFRESSNPQYGEYHYAGRWRMLGKTMWVVLKLLAEAPGDVDYATLSATVFTIRTKPKARERQTRVVTSIVSKLRNKLRVEFDLGPNWNPVPCLSRNGTGGVYSLYLPPEPKRRAAG
jgi:integrase